MSVLDRRCWQLHCSFYCDVLAKLVYAQFDKMRHNHHVRVAKTPGGRSSHDSRTWRCTALQNGLPSTRQRRSLTAAAGAPEYTESCSNVFIAKGKFLRVSEFPSAADQERYERQGCHELIFCTAEPPCFARLFKKKLVHVIGIFYL